MSFKPLLATEVDFKLIDYNNVWVSPKLDGIRAIVMNGVVFSRKLIPIPNRHVQKLFGRPEFEGLDGELIVGPAMAKDVYNKTYSGVMTVIDEPEVVFHVFDNIQMATVEYAHRLRNLVERVDILRYRFEVPVTSVSQVPVTSEEELLREEARLLDLGYEGAMLRAWRGPNSLYKFGRSTAKQGTLLKLKRFSDKEALIVGFEEEMANNNEATVDELGHTKRSSHQENKVGKGRLGALVCELNGVRFNIGTGFTAKMREDLWNVRDTLPGQLTKFKSFDIGVVDAPRFPVFLGLRSPIDM